MTLKVNPITPLASPVGEEGHEVAKGVQANWIHRGAPRPANPVRRHPAKSVWTVVILIMILDVDVTAEGGIIKLIAPSRGNERYEGKNSESYTSRTISAFSLFGGCRHHLARWEACHMTQKENPVTLTL